MCIELQRVYVFTGISLTNFHVQMRAKGVTFVSGQGKNLTLFQRKLLGRESQINRKGFVLVLIFFHNFFYFGREFQQMAVHRCISIVMSYIYSLSISSWSNRYPTDVAVCNATDRLPYHSLCLEIHPTMKVIRP